MTQHETTTYSSWKKNVFLINNHRLKKCVIHGAILVGSKMIFLSPFSAIPIFPASCYLSGRGWGARYQSICKRSLLLDKHWLMYTICAFQVVTQEFACHPSLIRYASLWRHHVSWLFFFPSDYLVNFFPFTAVPKHPSSYATREGRMRRLLTRHRRTCSSGSLSICNIVHNVLDALTSLSVHRPASVRRLWFVRPISYSEA